MLELLAPSTGGVKSMRQQKRLKTPRPARSSSRHSSRRTARSIDVAGAGLIPVDSTARRKQERASYQKRAQKLDTDTQRLRSFEEREIPAFELWVQCEFESDITTIRETEAAIESLERLLEDAESYAACKGISERAAFKILDDARESGRYEEIWAELAAQAAAAEDTCDDSERDPLDDFLDEAFAFLGDDGDDDDRQAPPDQDRRHASGENPAAKHMRDLYRQLVRVLHPDVNADLTDEQKRLWHEVQEAYEWGDVRRLELLHRAVTNSDSAQIRLETIPIGDLMALRRGIEARLRSIGRSLRAAKKHPAWDFSAIRQQPKKLAKLYRDAKQSIEADLEYALARRREMEWIVASFRKIAAKKPAPRGSRSSSPLSPRR
jgi:hypothetical protein